MRDHCLDIPDPAFRECALLVLPWTRPLWAFDPSVATIRLLLRFLGLHANVDLHTGFGRDLMGRLDDLIHRLPPVLAPEDVASLLQSSSPDVRARVMTALIPRLADPTGLPPAPPRTPGAPTARRATP